MKKATVKAVKKARKPARKPVETEVLPIVVTGPKAQKILGVNKFAIARLVRQQKLVPVGKNSHHRGGGYLFSKEAVMTIKQERRAKALQERANRIARAKIKPLGRKQLEKQGQKRLPFKTKRASKRAKAAQATG